MPLAELIVCESSSKWAVALRRQLRSGSDLRVRETRHLDDCWRQATASPSGLVALEATAANIEQLVVALQRYRLRRPHVRVVVLADRCLAEGEWLLREAGAVHVVYSPRELNPLVRLIRRHLERLKTRPGAASSGMAASKAAVTASASWEELPWGGAAGALFVARPDWLHDPAP